MKEKERNIYKGESKTPYKGNRLPQIVHQESRSHHFSGTPHYQECCYLISYERCITEGCVPVSYLGMEAL